uniref:NADH-ubiquinone oxidoreductase chain 4 n=1 Tax=Electrophorus electricus TaxID=8005 RepID=F7UI98_ELEEL|nr:NADH dehydrogenase subunit 4 [Electrophorus electricus]
MLKILVPTTMLLPTIWLCHPKWLWVTTTTQSMSIAILSLIWLNHYSETGWSLPNNFMATDPLSSPLLVLTCWLLPMTILATQNHIRTEPLNRQRNFLTLLVLLQILLILAFAATEIIMFYIMFEATLIPTLILITRWGNQTERLNAGTYFLFYTLTGSMPLLVALLLLQQDTGTLSLLMAYFTNPIISTSLSDKIWWMACLIAFLVKTPLYGIHLWLPKAHVEAPIAGSMILAAILLKLGGYGMMRMILLLNPLTKEMAYPFIILALWGVIMSSSICLRQTDLKSLIAYSSVGHMGLVTAGIMIQTPWSFSGVIILMIAHGLTSSALFCLANTSYERTHNRTLILTRGMQAILPLASTWWLLFNLFNLALPPTPNLMGELIIMSAMFNWSQWTIILTGTGTLITTAYSLHLFLTTQQGQTPTQIYNIQTSHTREHLLMILHLTPITLLMMKPELMWGWCF